MWMFREMVRRAKTDELREQLVPEQEPKLQTFANGASDCSEKGGRGVSTSRSDCVTLEVEEHFFESSSSQSTDAEVAVEATDCDTLDSEADTVDNETAQGQAQVYDNSVLEHEAAQRQVWARDNMVILEEAVERLAKVAKVAPEVAEASSASVPPQRPLEEPVADLNEVRPLLFGLCFVVILVHVLLAVWTLWARMAGK